ncbi:MAG: DUF3656 domain-containing protein [Coriobacteriia bacterium]
MVAAVRNGADAVYLGARRFNARQRARNFDLDGIERACEFAHVRGARVYLTVNVLLLPGEIQEALELVDSAWTRGVDAVIVQDLGLASAIREALPDVRLHASTQIGAHNVGTVRFLEGLGVSRVTLARELALDEVAAIVEGSSAEVEVFAHGALCVCYSGQCLFSSMVGGRSANRGRCAQPCRLGYEVRDASGPVSGFGPHPLSPKDLATVSILPELVASGVSALKIEGRAKSPEYVALVTGVYRRALDRALDDPDGFVVTEAEWHTLEEAFSRGFTPGYLARVADADLMAPTRPNDRGVMLGRVTAVEGRDVRVALERPLATGDTIELWTRKGRIAQTVEDLRDDSGAARRTVEAGEQAWLRVEGPVRAQDRAFRVEDAGLVAAARRTFSSSREPRPVPVRASITIRLDRPVELTLSTQDASVTVTGPVAERARTKEMTASEIMEHLGRTGGTPYAITEWDITLEPGVGMGFSVLHRLRREALEQLTVRRLEPWAGRRPRGPFSARELPTGRSVPSTPDRVELVVAVSSLEAARACLDAGADRCLLAVSSGSGRDADDTAAFAAEGWPDAVWPLLPRIAHDSEVSWQRTIASRADRCASGNLGVALELASQGVTVEADWPLNITNGAALAALEHAGVSSAWLSPELSAQQIARVAESTTIPVGVAVAGRQELMVTEVCLFASTGECWGDCSACAADTRVRLVDRKGYAFPARLDPAGRTHVLNSAPLDLIRVMGEVLATGVSMVRVEARFEDVAEAVRMTVAARTALDAAPGYGERAGRRDEPSAEPSTTGHFFRGVR